MEIRQLEAFVKVVETQSFSKAAKSAFLTQPTISAHIVSLEKELGIKLLERTTKTVHTTNAGEKLYIYAKEILGLTEEIYQEFGKASRTEVRIEIAGSTIPTQYILPELTPGFQKQNRNVYFSIHQGDSQYVIEEILKHKVSIGFVGMKNDDSRLLFIPFYQDKLVIITPNEEHYRSMVERKCSLEEMMKEPIILRESGSGTRKKAEAFLELKSMDIRKLNVVARINDQEIIKRSVSNGMGISIISKKAALDYAENGKILLFEPNDSENNELSRTLYIVFEKHKKLHRLEKNFIEFSSQFYREECREQS